MKFYRISALVGERESQVYYISQRRLNKWCKEHYWGDTSDPNMIMLAVFQVQYHKDKLVLLRQLLSKHGHVGKLHSNGGEIIDSFGGIQWPAQD